MLTIGKTLSKPLCSFLKKKIVIRNINFHARRVGGRMKGQAIIFANCIGAFTTKFNARLIHGFCHFITQTVISYLYFHPVYSIQQGNIEHVYCVLINDWMLRNPSICSGTMSAVHIVFSQGDCRDKFRLKITMSTI